MTILPANQRSTERLTQAQVGAGDTVYLTWEYEDPQTVPVYAVGQAEPVQYVVANTRGFRTEKVSKAEAAEVLKKAGWSVNYTPEVVL